MTSNKSKPMTRDEIVVMLDLIQTEPRITSKQTNATSNREKDEAWKKLTARFNAKGIYIERKMEQLRLKWDNLKKAARKRSHQIRMNNLKTGGRKPDYIPADDILDRIASILGTTCTGYVVNFGGDGQLSNGNDIVIGDVDINYIDNADVGTSETNDVPLTNVNTEEIEPNTKDIANSSTYLFGKRISNNFYPNKKKVIKRPIKEDNGCKRRNDAIADYYLAKMKKVDAEHEKILLEIALLKKQLDK